MLACVTESFTAGLGTAALLAVAMRAGEGEQQATRFAILTGLVGLARTLAGAVSGVGVERMGYAPWFALTVALALPALALAPRVAARLPEPGAATSAAA
jgi:PAT family beta-lactamase induction signal transducer AmpG